MLQSGLALLNGDPGNAILLNGVLQTADLEIGVPGFQPQVPTSTAEFTLRAARGVRSFKEFWRQSGAWLDRARLRRIPPANSNTRLVNLVVLFSRVGTELHTGGADERMLADSKLFHPVCRKLTVWKKPRSFRNC
jgi:hypothetical protein